MIKSQKWIFALNEHIRCINRRQANCQRPKTIVPINETNEHLPRYTFLPNAACRSSIPAFSSRWPVAVFLIYMSTPAAVQHWSCLRSPLALELFLPIVLLSDLFVDNHCKNYRIAVVAAAVNTPNVLHTYSYCHGSKIAYYAEHTNELHPLVLDAIKIKRPSNFGAKCENVFTRHNGRYTSYSNRCHASMHFEPYPPLHMIPTSMVRWYTWKQFPS